MIARWLERKIQLASVRSAREDLERFVASLRGMPDSELGMVVAIATMIRHNMTRQRMLPTEVLLKGITEQNVGRYQLGLSRIIKTFQKEGKMMDAAGTMVWLHSLRAFSTPEVRELGCAMWRELERGFDHVPDALSTLEDLTPGQISDATWEEYNLVPCYLAHR